MSSVAGTRFLPMHVCGGEKGVIHYFILRNWLTWLQRSITWFGSCVPAKVHVIKNWSLEWWYWAVVEPSENDAESLGHRGLSSQRTLFYPPSSFISWPWGWHFPPFHTPTAIYKSPCLWIRTSYLVRQRSPFSLWTHYLKCFMIK